MIQLASACGAGGGRRYRKRLLEVVAELGAEREPTRTVGAQARLLLQALSAGGRQLGHRSASGVEHLLVDRHRHEVGLGK